MKVYAFTRGKEGFTEIENTLEAEQAFVGGYIDVVSLNSELDLVCNDEGKILGLEERAARIDNGKIIDVICGDFFVCRHIGEDLTSIRESDKDMIKDILKPVLIRTGSYIIYGRHY